MCSTAASKPDLRSYGRYPKGTAIGDEDPLHLQFARNATSTLAASQPLHRPRLLQADRRVEEQAQVLYLTISASRVDFNASIEQTRYADGAREEG